MSSSAILFATLTIVVAAHARFIAPPLIHPIVPLPLIHPPMLTPIIRPFIHPIPPPIFPIIRERRVSRPSVISRPRSRPFVMEEPRGFLPREDEPVFINIVDNRDPIRDVVVIENKRQPMMIERPRYIEDSGNGDVSIDGNVYISDPYAANDIRRGASVQQVVSRAVGTGQLSTGNGMNELMDHPMPAAGFNLNLQPGPMDPMLNSLPVNLV